ncbi:MAG: DUF4962 domain-containing protein [Acidobacteriota bacterium]|nr:DUF4962 domain-containing protein [Acidobacteriota bacterium]
MKRAITLLLSLAAAASLYSQAPDRTPLPEEWGYRPADGSTVSLNPPSLCWVHEKDAAGYIVEWADNPEFERPSTVRDLRWSVYTHSGPLKPGTYHWRYRIAGADGRLSDWSRPRRFIVPEGAVAFPQPTMAQMRRRVPKKHPRLFMRPEDLPRLRAWAAGGGKEAYGNLIARANELLTAEPTPEPTVRANAYDPETSQYWWSNRVQTVKALQEAEILSFAWLLTGDKNYGERARRFVMRLAAWDPDGPTNFELNCEAAKPMLHRLARAYDWAWPMFTEAERAEIRAAMLRRAEDAWKSWEVRQGAGHLNRPYDSHGNRTWHKLGEYAIATLGESPEAERFLDYAVTKFFAAYPVWSDDDGGWHEGLSYFAGYMSKTTWWLDVARVALGIDGFKKPFFENFGDYILHSAPPGTPELGLGDLAYRRPSAVYAFMHYYVRRTGNPYWAWWLDAWKIPPDSGEPVLAFLRSEMPPVEPKAPADLPPSKVFRGTGVAVLNTTLLDAAENVEIRFKASPMGRSSHGHEPHNSFTLDAYGEALLVNNVYRDLYGTPFHKDWVWTSRAQNALLVDGFGQKVHSADLGGRIVKWDLRDGFDYLAGDATDSYEGRLKKALRHVVFVKPDLIILADEVEASRPSTFQWMLHGQAPFEVLGPAQRLVLEREKAGVVVDYISERPLHMRQWTGYKPDPDYAYLASIKSPGFPPQWHVEASSVETTASTFTLTVLRPYKTGAAPGEGGPGSPVRVERGPSRIALTVKTGEQAEVNVGFDWSGSGDFLRVRSGGREWKVSRPD